jgi:hypothetical protein
MFEEINPQGYYYLESKMYFSEEILEPEECLELICRSGIFTDYGDRFLMTCIDNLGSENFINYDFDVRVRNSAYLLRDRAIPVEFDRDLKLPNRLKDSGLESYKTIYELFNRYHPNSLNTDQMVNLIRIIKEEEIPILDTFAIISTIEKRFIKDDNKQFFEIVPEKGLPIEQQIKFIDLEAKAINVVEDYLEEPIERKLVEINLDEIKARYLDIDFDNQFNEDHLDNETEDEIEEYVFDEADCIDYFADDIESLIQEGLTFDNDDQEHTNLEGDETGVTNRQEDG